MCPICRDTTVRVPQASHTALFVHHAPVWCAATYLYRHLPAVGVVQHAALQRQGARQSAAVTCSRNKEVVSTGDEPVASGCTAQGQGMLIRELCAVLTGVPPGK
jgi:hypothetical protein